MKINIIFVEYAIDKVAVLEETRKLSQDINKAEYILSFANIVAEAVDRRLFESEEEFEEAKGNINEELGENFRELKTEEQKEVLIANRKQQDKLLEAELESVQDLPEEERIKAEQRLKERHNLIQKGRYNDILAEQDSKTAANAIIISDSEDADYGAETLLKTRATEEERSKTADYMDFDFQKELISDYKEVGDEISSESLKEYTEVVVSDKSKDAIEKYQEDYVRERNLYESALEKQKRGEKLTAEELEILNTMRKDYFTVTAEAIIIGIHNNINLSKEDKIEFVEKWINDAKQFDDFKNVIDTVKEELKHNKDLAKILSIDKNSNNNIDTNLNAEKSIYINKNKTIADTTTVTTAEYHTSNKSEAKANIKETKLVSQPIKQKSNNSVHLQKDLLTNNNIEEVLQTYNKFDVITTVLEDPQKYKKHMPTIIQQLKSAGKTQLTYIVNTSSDSVVVTLCNELGREKIEPLLSRSLCYTSREKIENMG